RTIGVSENGSSEVGDQTLVLPRAGTRHGAGEEPTIGLAATSALAAPQDPTIGIKAPGTFTPHAGDKEGASTEGASKEGASSENGRTHPNTIGDEPTVPAKGF